MKELKCSAHDGQRRFKWSFINVEVLKLEFERENFLLVKLEHIERKVRNQTIWVAGETPLQTLMYKSQWTSKAQLNFRVLVPLCVGNSYFFPKKLLCTEITECWIHNEGQIKSSKRKTRWRQNTHHSVVER